MASVVRRIEVDLERHALAQLVEAELLAEGEFLAVWLPLGEPEAALHVGDVDQRRLDPGHEECLDRTRARGRRRVRHLVRRQSIAGAGLQHDDILTPLGRVRERVSRLLQVEDPRVIDLFLVPTVDAVRLCLCDTASVICLEERFDFAFSRRKNSGTKIPKNIGNQRTI